MTDVEGSTTHLRALGDAYGAALARHHEIIREALLAHDGVEVGSEGDSFAAVFPSATSGLRAGLAAQRALLAADWPDQPWRVRMVVHAGEVQTGSAGAVGLALHEAARLRAVAHGGQILVSDPARASLDGQLPADVTLVDLGHHAVRDVGTRVRLHQAVAPGLPSTFPPPRTARAGAVPDRGGSFVGRAREITTVEALLGRHRVATLTGPGGSGKTRLAFEVARRHEGEVVVAELAGLTEAAQVAASVATVVGAEPDRIAESLPPDCLLVLDNCEHLLIAVADLVAGLVDARPDVAVLATSREPLGISAEQVALVPALELDDAVALFVERARGADDDTLVRAACEGLARMPLAIELAAARTRSLPLAELVARLDDQLQLLTRGARDVPRQQSLRATLDWSHSLLSDDERTVFRRSSVFAGGFTFEAAQAVCAEPGGVDVLDALDGLVQKSLVELSVASGRYRLLEPVRQYGVVHLVAAGEEREIRQRHLGWATELAVAANRQLFSPQQRQWTTGLDAERQNHGAAISWALEIGDPARAGTIVSNLATYWFTAGRQQALVWVPRVLEHADELSERDRVKVLLAAGITHCDLPGDDRPVEWLRSAAAIARDLGHDRSLGSALFWFGRATAGRGDREAAERAFEECARVHDRLGDRFGWGWATSWRGLIARTHGRLDEDEALQRQVLARCGDVPHVVAAVWGELAAIAAQRGDLAAAEELAGQAIDAYRRLGDRWQVAVNLANRAWLLVESAAESARCLGESLRILADLADEANLARTLRLAAFLLLAAGRPDQAALVGGPALERVGTEHHLSEELVGVAVDPLLDLVADPARTAAVEQGRRMRLVDLADSAAGWLAEAYGD